MTAPSRPHTVNQKVMHTSCIVSSNKCANIVTRVPGEIGHKILKEACSGVGTASVLAWVMQFERKSALRMSLEELLQGCMLLAVYVVGQDLFLPLCHVHSPFVRHRCRLQHGCDYTAISRYLSATGIRPLAVYVILDQIGDRTLNYNCITDLAPYCDQDALKVTINIPVGCSANIVRFLHPSSVLSTRVTYLALSPVEATPQLFETLPRFLRLKSLRIRWGPLWPSVHRDWPPPSISMICLLPSIRRLYLDMGPEDHSSVSTLRLPNVEFIEVRYKMPTPSTAASDADYVFLRPLLRKILFL